MFFHLFAAVTTRAKRFKYTHDTHVYAYDILLFYFILFFFCCFYISYSLFGSCSCVFPPRFHVDHTVILIPLRDDGFVVVTNFFSFFFVQSEKRRRNNCVHVYCECMFSIERKRTNVSVPERWLKTRIK